MNKNEDITDSIFLGEVGHMINPNGIPEKCPHCEIEPLVTKVINYNMMWHDGDVVCETCNGYIRMYDAG
jgi:hypothetical protein